MNEKFGILTRTTGSSHIVHSAYQNGPTKTCVFEVWVQSSNTHSWHIGSLRIGELLEETQTTNHCLYRIKLLLRVKFCYPKRNFGRNQLLEDSISLSPLYATLQSDLHVNIRLGPPPNFRSASSFSRKDHLLSGLYSSTCTQTKCPRGLGRSML